MAKPYKGRFNDVYGGPNSLFIGNLGKETLKLYMRGARVPECDEHSPIMLCLGLDQVDDLIHELQKSRTDLMMQLARDAMSS